MKILTILCACLAMSGCGNTAIKAQIAGANMEIARARADAMTKPLVDIRVPVPGCEGPLDRCTLHVVVRQPSGGGNDYMPSPDDPWARVAERAVGGLVTAGGIYLGGQAAASIVQGASAGIVDALRVQPAPTIVTQPAPTIVTTPDPVIVTQPAPVIMPTPDPVIVTQPAPVVITQPAPVIVQQP